ncbi:MAG: hypothetical protein EBZ78_12565 [Verrucomicrobia bacterium]|nr:hypothetical protein [Verrucomicrobiota bacterium]
MKRLILLTILAICIPAAFIVANASEIENSLSAFSEPSIELQNSNLRELGLFRPSFYWIALEKKSTSPKKNKLYDRRGRLLAKVTDEFIQPLRIEPGQDPLIRDGDVLFFFNFRADRMRQIVRSIADPDFDSIPSLRRPKVKIFTMTPYEADFTRLGVRPLLTPMEMNDLLGEVVAAHGLSQARMAETEKYPHDPNWRRKWSTASNAAWTI